MAQLDNFISKESNISKIIFAALLIAVFVFIFGPSVRAQFARQDGPAGWGHGYGYGYGYGYGFDGGTLFGYRTDFNTSARNVYGFGYGYGFLTAANVFNTTSNQYEVTPSTMGDLVTSGVMTPTGTAITNTAAVTFTQQVQVTVASGITLTIPANTTMTASSATTFAALAASGTVTVSDLPSGVSSVGAMSYGLPSFGLTLNQAITISINVGNTYNGSTLTIYRKPPGGSWTSLTTCTVSNSVCQFTTTSLSDFAVTVAQGTAATSAGGGGVSGAGTSAAPAVPAQKAAVAAPATKAQLQAQLNILISMLRNVLLQARILGIPIPAGAEQYLAALPSPTAFTRDLTLGSKGDDVKALQQFLNAQGFAVAATGAGSSGNETTHFGNLTKAALAKYQSANNISPAAGYFGLKTRAQVKKILGK